MADTTGDGRADIVGFGNDGVYVVAAQPDGTFGPVTRVVANFGPTAGGWQVDRHPRFVADTTGDGRADIVGFGDDGVYVSVAQPYRTFGPVTKVVDDFGYNDEAGHWRVSITGGFRPTPPATVAPTSSPCQRRGLDITVVTDAMITVRW